MGGSTRISSEGHAAALRRRVRVVVAFTITYNVIEAVIAITAGAVASSAALIAFGLDSAVEVLSAAAVAWQFAVRDHEARERAAMRVIAVSFFALAGYVAFDALRSVAGAAQAAPSTVGIVLAAVSLAVMPTVSWLERRAGRELGSASVVADSKQTLLCACLSAVLLAGLLLNALLGWDWADPAAAIVIAAVAVREGLAALRGDACCAPSEAALAGAGEDARGSDGGGCADACCAGEATAGGAPVQAVGSAARRASGSTENSNSSTSSTATTGTRTV